MISNQSKWNDTIYRAQRHGGTEVLKYSLHPCVYVSLRLCVSVSKENVSLRLRRMCSASRGGTRKSAQKQITYRMKTDPSSGKDRTDLLLKPSFGHGRTIIRPWPNDHSTVAEWSLDTDGSPIPFASVFHQGQRRRQFFLSINPTLPGHQPDPGCPSIQPRLSISPPLAAHPWAPGFDEIWWDLMRFLLVWGLKKHFSTVESTVRALFKR